MRTATIPENCLRSIEMARKGYHPGGFVMAVFRGDDREMRMRADAEHTAALDEIIAYVRDNFSRAERAEIVARWPR